MSEHGILYIEPSGTTSSAPVIDSYTRKMAAAFRRVEDQIGFPRGPHICRCGAMSSSGDYRLPNGEITNSLCVHYLAFHRAEVPPEQLAKVAALDCGEVEPTPDELKAPTGRYY